MTYTWLFGNNLKTTLAASISSTSTAITVASGYGANFPSPASGEAFPVTLYDAATGALIEICYCTSRSGDVLTVVRGQEGTTQQAFSAGAGVDLRLTAGVMANWVQSETFLRLDDEETQEVTGPVTFEGETEVPDTDDFTSKDALNAETAEGRYIGSVLASGSTNIRITDIQEDVSGNLIATMSDGTTESYAPVSTGAISGGFFIKTGPLLRQIFTITTTADYQAITFPVAFSSVPVVAFASSDAENDLSVIANVYRGTLTETGFQLHTSWIEGGTEGNQGSVILTVIAEGEA